MSGNDSDILRTILGDLLDKLKNLQRDVGGLLDTTNHLIKDKENNGKLIEALSEQIEFLRTAKADKEDLEDALAEKADACAINSKVSHDKFYTVCDELYKGIEEALDKLTQQEELWQKALYQIRKKVGNKLDKKDIAPLRNFINIKLKTLQQRMNTVASSNQEAEAAATKQYLKNLNCLSCDKEVVMRREAVSSHYGHRSVLPPSSGLGPYLTYELDNVRKERTSLPTTKNIIRYKTPQQDKSRRTSEYRTNKRNCGGNHTTTTPQQRLTRSGCFFQQWPGVQPISGSSRSSMKKDLMGTNPHNAADAFFGLINPHQHGITRSKENFVILGKRSNLCQMPVRPKISRTERIEGRENDAERKKSSTQRSERKQRGSVVSDQKSKRSSQASIETTTHLDSGKILKGTASQLESTRKFSKPLTSASPSSIHSRASGQRSRSISQKFSKTSRSSLLT